MKLFWKIIVIAIVFVLTPEREVGVGRLELRVGSQKVVSRSHP